MVTSQETQESPPIDSPAVGKLRPPPLHPASVTTEHHWQGVLLAVAGTFLATLLGVGVAQWLAQLGHAADDKRAYAAMVALMRTDCSASLEENKQFDPASATRPLRQSAFLYASAFQNALLLRFMDKAVLKDLMKAMSDAAWAEAAYSQALAQRERISAMGPPPPPYLAPPRPDLSGPLKEYLAAQQRVCDRLAQADK